MNVFYGFAALRCSIQISMLMNNSNSNHQYSNTVNQNSRSPKNWQEKFRMSRLNFFFLNWLRRSILTECDRLVIWLELEVLSFEVNFLTTHFLESSWTRSRTALKGFQNPGVFTTSIVILISFIWKEIAFEESWYVWWCDMLSCPS